MQEVAKVTYHQSYIAKCLGPVHVASGDDMDIVKKLVRVRRLRFINLYASVQLIHPVAHPLHPVISNPGQDLLIK